MIFVGLGVFILALTGLSFVHTLWASLIMLVFIGWGIITFFITANTTLQRRVPDELRGRVMSIYSFSFAGLYPFGSLLAGWTASRFGVADAFRMNAILLAAFAIPAYLFVRKLPRLSTSSRESVRELLVSEQEIFEAEQISKG
jgi:MFS family permease